jgi:PKD repeat protein
VQHSPQRVGVAVFTAAAAVLVAGCTAPAGSNLPPVAAFDLAREVVEVAELVVFNGNGSHDPEGEIATYQWNFGDGSLPEVNSVVAHAYPVHGTYTVTLTVTDIQGASNTHAANLTVNAPPTAILDVSPAPYFAKEPIAFSASFSHDPDGRIASFAWDFGDGATASSAEAAHAYGDTGQFDVSLVVTDDHGANARATVTLFADLHTYDVEFVERTNSLADIRNFTLANMTKTTTIEVFQLNITQITVTLELLHILPEGADPGDVVRLSVTSPEGASQTVEGSGNFTLSFNLNAIPSPVQTRAATPGDVPGILGAAYIGEKGRGVWVVEITAVQLGSFRDGGFVPEVLIAWQLHTTVTTYEAVPQQIA